MNKNTLNITQMWEMFKNMSLSQKMEFFSVTDQEKTQVIKVEDRRKTFLQQVTDWGYKSPTDFLIEGEFIPNPSVKKPRMVIKDDVRQNIVTDLTLKVPTKEIARKYGVTTDAVYNIKTKNGLTKPKTKKVPTTTTVTVPTPTVTVSPTTVPTPMVSETSSIVTPTVQSPELKKEAA